MSSPLSNSTSPDDLHDASKPDHGTHESMVGGQSIVHVLDDDPSVRKALERQLRLHGWTVRTFATVAEFEESGASAAPGCLLLDLRIPDGSGLDLLARLEQSGTLLGVILVSGYGDVQSTVRAMRLGALDFLTKPISEASLLEALGRASAKSHALWERQVEVLSLRKRLSRLTPREREVGVLVASGMLNKQVAFALGTSEKTIKVHRGRVMAKLEITSVAQLVRLLDRAREPSG
jgi:FixJ family two-component response regulator